ncbi:MAG: PPC domain-containing protein [Gammaproteobacteria bacterium]
MIRGNLFPNGDVDFYSFTANAGDRVYAAVMTSFSAGNSTDSQLTLLDSDGTTVIEFDDDNGSFAGLSSSILGATIPPPGTYFLKVNDFTAGTTSERPYELHFRLQGGAPTPKSSPTTHEHRQPLPANGWVSGTRNPAAATEQDWYSLTLNAGDTVFLSLDLDPERDSVTWNGRLGFALFGDAGNQILVADDAGTENVSPNPVDPRRRSS